MKNTNAPSAQCNEAILKDLRALVTRAEAMLGDSGESDNEMDMGSLGDRFDKTQARLADLYTGAKQRIIAGAKSTDTAIRANPYKSLALALGAGLVVGILFGRRSK
jgi:ElaB/YqjD/DUF883 family membrane-anchored ribosome-binding protein